LDLNVGAAVWLAASALWTRVMAQRGAERRERVVGLAAVGIGLVLGVVAGIEQPTLLDAYVLGGFGALSAVGGEARARRALGSGLVVLGLGLAGARAAGVFPALPDAGPGPVTLLLVLSVGSGVLAALGVRLLFSGAVQAPLVTAAVLWVTAGLHATGAGEAGFWGVLAGIRVQAQAVWQFGPESQTTPMAQRLMVAEGEVGLLLLTGSLLVLAVAALPRWRRVLLGGAAAFGLAALALLWLQGYSGLTGSSAAAVQALASSGQAVVPAPGGQAWLDLATVLPALAAVAAGLGLLDGSAPRPGPAAPALPVDVSSDLALALIAGLVLMGALTAVWREVWGTALWRETGALLAASAAVALGLRWMIGRSRELAWLGGMALCFGAALLPGAVGPAL
jgi:hypothetical protein